MAFSEYAKYDGLGLAELVAKKQVSAAELVEEAIARIEKHNPRLNAVVYKTYDRARAAARGDSVEAVILVASRAAPSDAVVSLASTAGIVSVSVVSGPRVAASLLPTWIRASSTASATRESSDPGP